MLGSVQELSHSPDEYEEPEDAGPREVRGTTTSDPKNILPDFDGSERSRRLNQPAFDAKAHPLPVSLPQLDGDSEEQIVAEALFDLANMFHQRASSPPDHTHREASKHEGSGKRRTGGSPGDGDEYRPGAANKRQKAPRRHAATEQGRGGNSSRDGLIDRHVTRDAQDNKGEQQQQWYSSQAGAKQNGGQRRGAGGLLDRGAIIRPSPVKPPEAPTQQQQQQQQQQLQHNSKSGHNHHEVSSRTGLADGHGGKDGMQQQQQQAAMAAKGLGLPQQQQPLGLQHPANILASLPGGMPAWALHPGLATFPGLLNLNLNPALAGNLLLDPATLAQVAGFASAAGMAPPFPCKADDGAAATTAAAVAAVAAFHSNGGYPSGGGGGAPVLPNGGCSGPRPPPKFKRCATHVYIAHFILTQQQQQLAQARLAPSVAAPSAGGVQAQGSTSAPDASKLLLNDHLAALRGGPPVAGRPVALPMKQGALDADPGAAACAAPTGPPPPQQQQQQPSQQASYPNPSSQQQQPYPAHLVSSGLLLPPGQQGGPQSPQQALAMARNVAAISVAMSQAAHAQQQQQQYAVSQQMFLPPGASFPFFPMNGQHPHPQGMGPPQLGAGAPPPYMGAFPFAPPGMPPGYGVAGGPAFPRMDAGAMGLLPPPPGMLKSPAGLSPHPRAPGEELWMDQWARFSTGGGGDHRLRTGCESFGEGFSGLGLVCESFGEAV